MTLVTLAIPTARITVGNRKGGRGRRGRVSIAATVPHTPLVLVVLAIIAGVNSTGDFFLARPDRQTVGSLATNTS